MGMSVRFVILGNIRQPRIQRRSRFISGRQADLQVQQSFLQTAAVFNERIQTRGNGADLKETA